jgi:hypothetical protein
MPKKVIVNGQILNELKNLAVSNRLPMLTRRFERAQQAWELGLKRLTEGEDRGRLENVEFAGSIVDIGEAFKACLAALRDMEGVVVRTQNVLEVARQELDEGNLSKAGIVGSNVAALATARSIAAVDDEELRKSARRFEITCDNFADALKVLETAIDCLAQ